MPGTADGPLHASRRAVLQYIGGLHRGSGLCIRAGSLGPSLWQNEAFDERGGRHEAGHSTASAAPKRPVLRPSAVNSGSPGTASAALASFEDTSEAATPMRRAWELREAALQRRIEDAQAGQTVAEERLEAAHERLEAAEAHEAELEEANARLQNQVAELQEACTRLQQENAELRSQAREPPYAPEGSALPCPCVPGAMSRFTIRPGLMHMC
jgi:hypothetical protein